MALGSTKPRSWMGEIGCEVAGNRRRFKFLGVWSGKCISQQEITEKIVNSIEKRLKSWVNRSLTFNSRLLLIRHVLTGIPSHHIMIVGLDSKGLGRITMAIRCFLWGFSAERKPKLALIAWSKLTCPKTASGLGWIDFQARRDSQLAAKAVRIISCSGRGVSWISLAEVIICKHLERRPQSSWWCNKLKWRSSHDMLDHQGNWRDIIGELTVAGQFPEELDKYLLEESWRVISSASPVTLQIEELNCWRWNSSEHIPGFKTVDAAHLLRVLHPKEGSTQSPLYFHIPTE
ncbi:hypothetical protein R1sor_024223 [Riccia sorocarpa]|uniref:Maturase n=1 Tax=Riccia sorocarpa TaxID=122646 RepID=A0ABD3GS38_9MARC